MVNGWSTDEDRIVHRADDSWVWFESNATGWMICLVFPFPLWYWETENSRKYFCAIAERQSIQSCNITSGDVCATGTYLIFIPPSNDVIYFSSKIIHVFLFLPKIIILPKHIMTWFMGECMMLFILLPKIIHIFPSIK